DAAAGPVGQLVRVVRRPERERPVDGAEAPQLLADPEVAAGRRGRPLADTHRRLEDLLAVLEELGLQRPPVDHELSVDQVELAQDIERDQARAAVCAAGDDAIAPLVVYRVHVYDQY